MLFRRHSDLKTIDARTSDILERIQRIEAEQAALRAEIEGERRLRFLSGEIVGAAQLAPVIGSDIEAICPGDACPTATRTRRRRRSCVKRMALFRRHFHAGVRKIRGISARA